jgi:hypothetical protein
MELLTLEAEADTLIVILLWNPNPLNAVTKLNVQCPCAAGDEMRHHGEAARGLNTGLATRQGSGPPCRISVQLMCNFVSFSVSRLLLS